MRPTLFAALLLTACGGFEGNVTQKFDITRNDVAGSTIAREKELDPEGAVWNTFLANAKADLGADAESITVTSVKLTFEAAESKGVGKFEEAIRGLITVYAKEKDTNVSVDLGTLEDPRGNGTVELDAAGVDLAAMGAKFRSGLFRLGLKGDIARPGNDYFLLRTTVTLGLEAK